MQIPPVNVDKAAGRRSARSAVCWQTAAEAATAAVAKAILTELWLRPGNQDVTER